MPTSNIALSIEGLRKSYGTSRAIDAVDIELARGEIVALLGSSGCGKTTTLRCVAGLEQPDSGTIRIDGRTVYSKTITMPAEERDIGMVFQSYALWPHMTVYENVAYKLRIRKWARKDIDEMVMSRLDLVDLTSFRDRLPGSLSGGQQQRVALARSLAGSPALILFDEPLSNLDARLRERMRSEVRSLIKKLGLSALYVTHDQAEALSIADRVALMDAGTVCEIASPRDIFRKPASRIVAEFFGSVNFLHSDFAGATPDLHGVADGATFAIRSEDVSLQRDSMGQRLVAGKIVAAEFVGQYSIYQVAAQEHLLNVHSSEDFANGESVFVSIDPAKILQVK